MSMLSRTGPGRTVVVMGFALLALGAQSANAAHEIHHRYTVWGQVQYEDNTPAAEIDVQLMIKHGEVMGEVKTDGQGHYRTVLHLHNEDLYKVFDMRVNNVTRKVRILFNANDRKTERGQRVDFIIKRKGEFESSATPAQ